MKYLDLKDYLKGLPFFSLETIRLKEPTFNSIQLTRWQKKGYIQSIIRGWYIFSDIPLTEELLMLIANKLITPSYISLEFALSLYNLIPEGVFHLTSVTPKKTQQFNSEIAVFSYRYIKPKLIFGYHLQDTPFGKANVADLEKAILDLLYLTPQANNEDFFSEIRLNKGILKKKLNEKKFKNYLNVFNNKKLTKRSKRLLDYAIN